MLLINKQVAATRVCDFGIWMTGGRWHVDPVLSCMTVFTYGAFAKASCGHLRRSEEAVKPSLAVQAACCASKNSSRWLQMRGP